MWLCKDKIRIDTQSAVILYEISMYDVDVLVPAEQEHKQDQPIVFNSIPQSM